MKRITEDYVSYEIAKLLKEKGFDSNMYTCYTDCEFPEFLTMIDYVVQGEEYERSNFESHNLIQAPTHQMTLKWLREVHKMYIYIKPLEDGNCFSSHLLYNGIDKLIEGGAWGSYESACEAALLYALKNI